MESWFQLLHTLIKSRRKPWRVTRHSYEITCLWCVPFSCSEWNFLRLPFLSGLARRWWHMSRSIFVCLSLWCWWVFRAIPGMYLKGSTLLWLEAAHQIVLLLLCIKLSSLQLCTPNLIPFVKAKEGYHRRKRMKTCLMLCFSDFVPLSFARCWRGQEETLDVFF